MTADVHSHILPRLDDGAKSLPVAEKILKQLRSAGVEYLALTPHFYPSRHSVQGFLEARNRAVQKMKTLPCVKEFHFSLGAETYLTESLFNKEELFSLCYSGTKLLLTELEDRGKLGGVLEERIERLILNCGVVPVIAHIDRYSWLLGDTGALRALQDAGCYLQLNPGSASNPFKRARVFRAVEQGFVDFLGNDLHEPFSKGKLKYSLSLLRKAGGSGFVEKADRNAKELIFMCETFSKQEDL